jgi:hypothetical protein
MIRAIATALLCAVAVIVADALFRISLLDTLRPVIVSPTDRAVLEPPVPVRWQGPHPMRARLSLAGEAPRDLGLRESPFDIPAEYFPREGGYTLDLQWPRLWGWVRATRRVQVHERRAAPVTDGSDASTQEIRDLFVRALAAARAARDTARARSKFLKEENAALRTEGERMAKQLEALYAAQEEDAADIAELERRLAQGTEENRSLSEDNAALRFRLASVIPCTVWGYYSYPRPNTIPVTRRALMVSDIRGRIFRTQPDCETIRRADPTADTYCFCVGNSWGG